MSRSKWEIVKHSKAFYVRNYRNSLNALMFSLTINLLLCGAICYMHFNEPLPLFFATSGIVPPVLLPSLDAPNNSSTPLLQDESLTDDEKKITLQ
ncbi:MAG: phosphoesterase [Legionella sp.]|nr:phosphoesterase [Legionella sp.]